MNSDPRARKPASAAGAAACAETPASRWQRLDELFAQAVGLSAEERAAYLSGACVADPALRAELAALLLAHDAAEGFLSGLEGARPLAPVPPAAAGQQIGCYRLVRRLAAGGMGVVYEAEQQAPPRRVALKVLPATATDPVGLRCFHREVESLARLNHAHIATLYEAGTTAEGLHYFAMEFVAGVPLDEHVRQGRPGRAARLRLFRQLCGAVAYAHQRGVLHRDLKPANVFVTPGPHAAGAEPQIKVLDFGLAQLLDAAAPRASALLGAGTILGTLAYMSPEQARGELADLDVRTDVYALGVMLYELLTDRRPYDVSGCPLPQAVRIVCEAAPIPPGRLHPGLRGDLEAIALKALAKSPAERYASVAELAADLQRQAGGFPVAARPTSAVYHLRRWAVRHRLACSVAALIAAVVLASGAGLGALYFRARSAQQQAWANQQRAEREAAKAQAISDFLRTMLESVDADANGSTDVTVRQVLDAATANLASQPDDEPEVRATLLDIIGYSNFALGRYALAADLLRDAAARRARCLGAGHPDTISTCNKLGMALAQQGLYEEAEGVFRTALAADRRARPADYPERTVYLQNLAFAVHAQGRRAETEPILQEVLALRRRLLGAANVDTAGTLVALAALRTEAGDYVAAETLYTEALALQTEVLGPRHVLVATTLNNLALCRIEQQQCAAAAELLRTALAVATAVLGPEHPETAAYQDNYANALRCNGDLITAEAVGRSALAIRRRTLGADHEAVALSLRTLARIEAAAGTPVAACCDYRDALALLEDRLGPAHPRVVSVRRELAELEAASGVSHSD